MRKRILKVPQTLNFYIIWRYLNIFSLVYSRHSSRGWHCEWLTPRIGYRLQWSSKISGADTWQSLVVYRAPKHRWQQHFLKDDTTLRDTEMSAYNYWRYWDQHVATFTLVIIRSCSIDLDSDSMNFNGMLFLEMNVSKTSRQQSVISSIWQGVP